MMRPPRTTTAPTTGFGRVVPPPALGERERAAHEALVSGAELHRITPRLPRLSTRFLSSACSSPDRGTASRPTRSGRRRRRRCRAAPPSPRRRRATTGSPSRPPLPARARSGRPTCSSSSTRHRPLGAGLSQAAQDLRAVERLAPAVLLDHQRQHLVDALVGREAPAAADALAAAPDDLVVVGRSGVDDLVFDRGAEGAAHGRWQGGCRGVCSPTHERAATYGQRRDAQGRPRHHRRRPAATMGVDPARVAVERNHDVVPRADLGRRRPGRRRQASRSSPSSAAARAAARRRLGQRRATTTRWSWAGGSSTPACSSGPASTGRSRRGARRFCVRAPRSSPSRCAGST